ncbi:hypothetical protein LCGC14_3027410, partial [marine sediment metagenome]
QWALALEDRRGEVTDDLDLLASRAVE